MHSERPPARKQYVAHPYQQMIVDHIIETPRCAVWAGMGMGKTSASLTALDLAEMLDGNAYPALVLAPLRVARSTWPSEANKWEHLRNSSIIPIVGSETERRIALSYKAPIYSCNYENLPWLVERLENRWPFPTVVADEATRLKSFRLGGYKKDGSPKKAASGLRSQALARIAHTKIKRFIELTGTPAPNGLQDLWGQMWFLDGGKRLGHTHGAYMQRWFQKSFDGYGSIALPFAQEQIHAALRDVCITVDAKDWFDLKEPIVRNIFVDLPPKARLRYKEMENEMFTRIEGRDIEAFNAAARTQKCLQLASGAAYLDPLADGEEHPKAKEWRVVHDEKLEALDSILSEANGMPVLVAYHFKSDLARILRAFPKAEVLDADPNTEKRWNEGKIPMLCVHPGSAGHGLNLQDGGNILVYFSHWWDLEQRMQVLERIGPMRQLQSGHDRPVWVYNIVARDTVDELVIARTESKREVQDILLDAMKRKK